MSSQYRSQHQQRQQHQYPQQQQPHTEFFNSNGNGNANRTYSTERSNGSRYSGSNASNNNGGGNKYSNKSSGQQQQQQHANNMSISPPLSVASSGSGSTNSGTKNGANNRNSKSYTMQTMNTHRNNGNANNIPTTPTIQQSHNAYFSTQNISFFHSATPNVGVQPIFSSAISPTAQSQHSSLPISLYVQQNGGALAYHPNNNYHYHNRNYHGNKKNWQFNNKSKSKMNANYSSSNSSTASSTHSNSTGKSDSASKPVSQSSQLSRGDNAQPSVTAAKPSKSSKGSLKKSKSTEKMPVKKTAHKSTQVESPLPSDPKIISLSDSETCNSKPKQHHPHHQPQLPFNDFFRTEKSKAVSSPMINMNSASSLSSGANSPTRTISHSFLSAIDNDTLKNSAILTDQRSASYDKPSLNNGIESSLLGFPQQRTATTTATPIPSDNSTMQMDAFKNLFNRLRYIDQTSMHQFSEPTARINNLMGTIDGQNISPSRIKPNFATNVPQQKRR